MHDESSFSTQYHFNRFLFLVWRLQWVYSQKVRTQNISQYHAIVIMVVSCRLVLRPLMCHGALSHLIIMTVLWLRQCYLNFKDEASEAERDGDMLLRVTSLAGGRVRAQTQIHQISKPVFFFLTMLFWQAQYHVHLKLSTCWIKYQITKVIMRYFPFPSTENDNYKHVFPMVSAALALCNHPASLWVAGIPSRVRHGARTRSQVWESHLIIPRRLLLQPVIALEALSPSTNASQQGSGHRSVREGFVI